VLVALGIQYATRMRRIVICVLHRSRVYFHNISQTAGFSKKKVTEHKMCFGFSLQLLSETILILRRIQRDMIKIYIVLHVRYPLY
jgi:hypothetical protein